MVSSAAPRNTYQEDAYQQSIPKDSVQILTQAAMAAQQLSRQDHIKLSSLLLATFSLSPAERNAINRLFDQVRLGKVKLVD